MQDQPENIGQDSQTRSMSDRVDLGHEQAGLQVGRLQRFLTNDTIDVYGESSKDKADKTHRSMLQILLMEDAQYAALYSQVQYTVNKAQQAATDALANINQRLDATDSELRTLQDSASTLEDGTKVFLSENDKAVYTENGRRFSNENAQHIHIKPDAPSWESYQNAKNQRAILAAQKSEVEDYQRDVLDEAQERLNDQDNPPSMEELEGLKDNIDRRMPKSVQSFYATDTHSISVAQDIKGQDDFSVPDIDKAFTAAHDGIPALTDIQSEADTGTPSTAPII